MSALNGSSSSRGSINNNGVTPDFSTMLRDFELAVYNITKESTTKLSFEGISNFKKSEHVIPASKYVLEHSKKPDVHFHAVQALQEAVFNQWSLLGYDAINAIKNYLIQYATRGVAVLKEIPSHVKAKVIQTVAAIIKRAWLGQVIEDQQNIPAANRSLIEQIRELIQSNVVHVLLIGIAVCKELVAEFSASTDTKMSIAWEYHRLAKQYFETESLQHIFVFVLQTAQQILALQSEDERRTAKPLFFHCFDLMEKVLSWPFGVEKRDKTINDLSIFPGVSWRTLLVKRTDVLALYIKLYQVCKDDPDLAPPILQGINHMASINGPIFEDEQQRVTYLHFFVQGLLQILLLEGEVSVSDLACLSTTFRHLAVNFPVEMFKTITKDPTYFFTLLTKFTCTTLFESQKVTTESKFEDAFHDFLETWMVFLEEDKEADTAKAQFYEQFCVIMFQHYAETRLNSVSSDSIPDHITLPDELKNIATIGRIAVGPSCNFLLHLLGKDITALSKRLTSPDFSLGEDENRRLNWLAIITGNLLVVDETTNNNNSNINNFNINNFNNSNNSTIPKKIEKDMKWLIKPAAPIPPSILNFSNHCPPNQDPVITLINGMLKLVEFENISIVTHKISTWNDGLRNSLNWFLNRWCSSYLVISPKGLSTNLIASFGSSQDQGATGPIFEFFVKKVALNLFSWNGNVELAEESCNLFLTVAHKPVVPAIVNGLRSWEDLLHLHCSNDPRIVSLPPSVQRKLTAAMVALADKMEGTKRLEIWKQIFEPIKKELVYYIHAINSNNINKVSNFSHALIVLLEKLRGIIRGSSPVNSQYVWSQTQDLMGHTITSIFGKCSDHHSVEYAVLRLWLDNSRCLLNYLSVEGKEQLLDSLFTLSTVFQQLGFGKRRRNRQTAEQDDEQQSKIYQILKIIKGSIVINHPKTSRTVYYSTSVVNQAIQDYKEFPKLIKLYYNVIELLFTLYPDKAVLIPESLLNLLLSDIDRSLSSPDLTKYSKFTLPALTHLFTYFTYNPLPSPPTVPIALQPLLLPYFKKILDFIVVGDVFDDELIARSARALYALMSFYRRLHQVEPLLFQIQKLTNNNIQVTQRFQELEATISLDGNDLEAVKITFIECFKRFISTYRGIFKQY